MAFHDTMYMTSYYPSQYYSEVPFASNNPYVRYASPAPTMSSLRRQRSSSVPSVHYSGIPEHHPVEPKRRQGSSRRHHHRGSRQPRYSRESQLVNPDIIDMLDDAGFLQYHHEGPYDAVYPERNRNSKHSPIEALKESNAEAIKATPQDKIADCLDSHRPLDGVAFFPPGTTDRDGHTYDYEEGPNMMNEYGNFTRCPGLKFTDEDFKNDPFYNKPIPKPFSTLRKVLSLRRNRRSVA
ncbi:hypothetical protein ASPWEDRAFT_44080 [Aspergillus wentii DTO 134E9]|uniref:Pal1 cell morphology protein n=1 Tax=Aspergillus wentii DTO 134E9 TaxID=1073089 RepID=A0A1L9RAU7_ASPWE|nr:uncharacterized protein ASPWEDRAFT_44080 [Aspergillus wentii DTO 134E9]KAI9934634.1 hypothetical protein MW887_000250 [Aspergillus wentii]OJJ32056.1 hypothetical protein ASPWEDRAFT_44080 [Aspergillus wentii DTO 134E9]